jgi:hypothetical protein
MSADEANARSERDYHAIPYDGNEMMITKSGAIFLFMMPEIIMSKTFAAVETNSSAAKDEAFDQF